MHIALVNTMSPFIRGGAEILVDDLKEQLHNFGHTATLYRLPFPTDFGIPLMNTIVAARTLRLDDYERVIAFKFPAYCVQHRAKVMWMFHQFRQVYELENTEFGLGKNGTADRIAQVVRRADNEDIPKSRHIYTNAYEVTNRLKKYNNIDSKVLPPPLKNAESYYCEKQGDYVFYPSRINSMKRQHLVVEAMKYTRSGVKLIIAGQCPDIAYLNQMKAFVNENSLQNKVVIRNEWISDEEKISLMADALAGIYIPYQEDSCGFVTMEAQYCAKPVLTCTDSGGTVEFVENGVSGYFAEPTPDSIAAELDKLYEDKRNAEKMGQSGYQSIMKKDITWENTIRRLLK